MIQISVIVCAKNLIGSQSLIKNINSTIGCKHEIILINNSKNKYSIFQAYNEGIFKSKGDLLCFIHDDIEIYSKNWGRYLLNQFDTNPDIGLIGLAGAKVKTKMASTWWDCPEQYQFQNIYHQVGSFCEHKYNWPEPANVIEVSTIDGVFMVCRSQLGIIFDESMKGFHFYDLNLSLLCHDKGFKVCVTNQIDIVHHSRGNLDRSWILSATHSYKKFEKNLPLIIDAEISRKALRELEFENGILLLERILKHRFYVKSILIWLKLFILNPFSNKLFKSSFKFLKLKFKQLLKRIK